MSSNSFGQLFRMTTWGESHGKAIGVVIDGCPAGLELSNEDINQALSKRAPGQNAYTSPRQEKDNAEIYSGVFQGKTTGTPISIIIFNNDANSNHYEINKHLLKPGHANFTYTHKYGIFDYRGGGRASARETACRVAAGAIAQKILNYFSIQLCAYLISIEKITVSNKPSSFDELKSATQLSPIFCPDKITEESMIQKILSIKKEGDSLGGIVEWKIINLPIGLGDPVYEKLEANLAKAMLSLPASKGFEIGEGFSATKMQGSKHNDLFENSFQTATNHAGGVLAGISTGMPLIGRVAFKPPSHIKKPQKTVNFKGKSELFNIPEGSRHDPCVAIRAVPVVEAMCALVLVDALLMHRHAKL